MPVGLALGSSVTAPLALREGVELREGATVAEALAEADSEADALAEADFLAELVECAVAELVPELVLEGDGLVEAE